MSYVDPSKRALFARAAIIAVAAPLVLSAAFAQTVITAPSWVDDDDALAQDYVTTAPPSVIEYHQTLTPGSIIPEGVPLQLFPANASPKLQGYAYFVSVDHKLVVVQADTRRVVRIMSSTKG